MLPSATINCVVFGQETIYSNHGKNIFTSMNNGEEYITEGK